MGVWITCRRDAQGVATEEDWAIYVENVLEPQLDIAFYVALDGVRRGIAGAVEKLQLAVSAIEAAGGVVRRDPAEGTS